MQYARNFFSIHHDLVLYFFLSLWPFQFSKFSAECRRLFTTRNITYFYLIRKKIYAKRAHEILHKHLTTDTCKVPAISIFRRKIMVNKGKG